jgi:hypothetical protein
VSAGDLVRHAEDAEVEMLGIAARLIDRVVDRAVAVAPMAAQDQ